MENGTKYVAWKQFTWILGIFVTIFIVSFGYLYTQNNSAVTQVQANAIMISRLDERLTNIMNTIIEIKDILREK